MYPEDYEIRRKSLMRRWIAEGFVCRKRGLSAEKVAQSYFYELVNRNMVIPIGISSIGEIKSVRVHDMMLEIIVSKSLEENFVSLVGGEYNLIHDKIRRLSVQSTGQDNLAPSINLNLAHTRSLTIFGNPNKWIKSKQLRLVRVLDLEGNREIRNGHLKYLCRMFQLKYLSLRGTNISRLPPKIRKLQNLETIDIRDTNIRELPSGIVKLQNLTHFYGGRSYRDSFLKLRHGFLVLPPGVQNMKNIQTLTQIYLNESGSVIQELGELAQITKLGVRFPHAKKEPFCSALEKLSMSLRTLELWLENPSDNSFQFLDSLKSPPTLLRSLELCGGLEKLPHWFPPLNNLTELKLYLTRHLNHDAFEVLQKLPSFIILHQVRAYDAEELIFVEESFPSLRVFIFSDSKIPILRFKDRAAPMLEKLVLGFWEDMGAFSGIEYLKNLKEIALKLPKGDDFGRVVEDLRKAADSNPNKPKFTVEYD